VRKRKKAQNILNAITVGENSNFLSLFSLLSKNKLVKLRGYNFCRICSFIAKRDMENGVFK